MKRYITLTNMQQPNIQNLIEKNTYTKVIAENENEKKNRPSATIAE